MNELSPGIKASVMNETEDALRDFVRSAHNIGLSKGEIAMMLHKIAEELAPALLIPKSETMQ